MYGKILPAYSPQSFTISVFNFSPLNYVTFFVSNKSKICFGVFKILYKSFIKTILNATSSNKYSFHTIFRNSAIYLLTFPLFIFGRMEGFSLKTLSTISCEFRICLFL